MNHYLAVDIGASSGRVIWGTLREGALRLQEIRRFGNGFHEKDGKFCWDIEYLFGQILSGLQKAKTLGVDECTLGIDTWAVDYVLLDRKGRGSGRFTRIAIPGRTAPRNVCISIFRFRKSMKKRASSNYPLTRFTSCSCMTGRS